MILTTLLIKERMDWLREQAGFILVTKEEERSANEREWLRWAERRIHALQKETQP